MKILEGVRVIDATGFVVGSSAAARLADMGADVIKIEQKGYGDPQRGLRSFAGVSLELPGGRNCAFEATNRNKRSLAIDLRLPESRAVMRRLAEKSDILVTNFRPDARKKLGIDYATISGYNPRLVYVSATGFGEKGPVSRLGGFDPVAQARSGIMTSSGEPDMPPVLITIGLLDEGTSWNMVIGALSGLIAREKHGIGQEIVTSLFGTTISLSSWMNALYFFAKVRQPRQSRKKPANPLWNFYKCRDKWIYIGSPFEKDWAPFCRALGLEDLISDPRFDTPDRRTKNSADIVAILDRVMGDIAYSEVAERLARQDIVFSPIQDIDELLTDPQVLENKYITEYDHEALGKVVYTGPSVQYSKTPTEITRRAPECGEHTEEVLLETGFTWEEIGTLRDAEVI